MEKETDVVIVGTGAAGLFCALQLPESKEITVITKDEARNSDSFLAQGGICVLRSEDDYYRYLNGGTGNWHIPGKAGIPSPEYCSMRTLPAKKLPAGC